jgi:adenosylcobyric acid synthase
MDYDAVILPGSKNVFFDMNFLKESGFVQKLLEYEHQGGRIVGICGGYQMLGTHIQDPHGVEDRAGETPGIDLLPIYSIMEENKITKRFCGLFNVPGAAGPIDAEGYEIHMGRTFPVCDADIIFLRNDGATEGSSDIARRDGRVWGTYLHGLFESDMLRTQFLKWLTNNATIDNDNGFSYRAYKEHNYDMLAGMLEQQVNIARIFHEMKMPYC